MKTALLFSLMIGAESYQKINKEDFLEIFLKIQKDEIEVVAEHKVGFPFDKNIRVPKSIRKKEALETAIFHGLYHLKYNNYNVLHGFYDLDLNKTFLTVMWDSESKKYAIIESWDRVPYEVFQDYCKKELRD